MGTPNLTGDPEPEDPERLKAQIAELEKRADNLAEDRDRWQREAEAARAFRSKVEALSADYAERVKGPEALGLKPSPVVVRAAADIAKLLEA